MSDLFDSLSARFTAATQPAIRPRPQSRFEGVQDSDAPVEEDSFEPARTPEPSASQPVMKPARKTERGPSSDPAQTRPRDVTKDASTSPKQAKPETPLTPLDPIETTQRAMQHDAATQSQPETSPTSTDRLNEETTQRTDPSAEAPRADVPPDPIPLEDIAETHVHDSQNATPQSPPIETRIVEAPTEPPQAPQPPDTRSDGYSIRIGRIEMRQPTPPPPPAPAPAPPPPRRAAAAAPSAMNGGARSGSSGSGLTDYLGWKRR